MNRTRRKYTREFKLEAVRLLESSGRPAADIEQELGVSDGCLAQWQQKLGAEDTALPQGDESGVTDRERMLRRENEILRQERDSLKTSCRDLPATKQRKFQFIDAHRNEFGVRLMCKVLEVSRSGYHAWRTRPPSAREMINQALLEQIGMV